MSRCFLHLPLVVVVVWTGQLQAENWPEFRGPTGQGISAAKGLPIRWNPATEQTPATNVRWKVNVPGKGWSSPVVVDGHIYLTTAIPRDVDRPKDQSLHVLCLNADTGATQWDVEVFQQDQETSGPVHGKNSHASPTPIVRDNRLYVHFGSNGTACLTLEGGLVWENQNIKYNMRHGNGGSPVLVDDRLIFSCDGYDIQFVVALDRKTGKIRWKKTRPKTEPERKFAFSTPLVIEVAGQKQVVCPGANVVVAYDPLNGREIWMVRYDGFSVVPRPVSGHGLVFLGTSFAQAKLLAIRPDGTGDVTSTHVAWRKNRGVPHTPSMLLVGEELYYVSDKGGAASCVDAVTGKKHWTKRLGGNFSASPIFADGRIYFQDEAGTTTVIKPGKKYVEVARNKMVSGHWHRSRLSNRHS